MGAGLGAAGDGEGKKEKATAGPRCGARVPWRDAGKAAAFPAALILATPSCRLVPVWGVAAGGDVVGEAVAGGEWPLGGRRARLGGGGGRAVLACAPAGLQ